jgi:integrase
VDAETVRLLSDHKRSQARPFGLVFTRPDGSPLPLKSVGQGEFARLITAAKVRPIRFHDLRHTTATLLLQSGEPVQVVADRLGHASP